MVTIRQRSIRNALWAFIVLTGIACSVEILHHRFSPVDFNTEVKPIINTHCISCHGGVKKNGDFSLLTREEAFLPTASGLPAIVPGKPGKSLLIKLITSEDTEERMPKDREALSAAEVRVLKRWIRQGAEWGLHWAYRPLKEEEESIRLGFFTSGKANMTIPDRIDKSISKKLESVGLRMNPPADKAELLRRLSLDIVGLPPSKDLTVDFVEGRITYSELVDHLLEMPGYGEKWSSMWLDIARYADSKGFERDASREIWHYRDYVIRAFNEDLPYNQFILEQMAGDMLENPSADQMIATGFHRNTQTNDEGGTDNEEFRVKAVIDRVNTTWEGIMGTTMSCVQCHGHPYDPIQHKDFYASFAFLNNTRDSDTHMDYPRIKLLDSLSEHQLRDLLEWVEKIDREERKGDFEKMLRYTYPVIYSIETDDLFNAAHYDTKYLGLRKNGYARILGVDLSEKRALLIKGNIHRHSGSLTLRLDHAKGPLIGTVNLSNAEVFKGLFEISLKHEIKGKRNLYLGLEGARVNDEDARIISFDWFYFYEGFPGEKTPEQFKYRKLFLELLSVPAPSSLIMMENPEQLTRTTHLFERGNWLSPGEVVEPGTPKILPELMTPDPDRMDFARWIVDEQNPLTARTFVNRVWEQLFGRGIVFTVEDLGSQGSQPTHQELLDFLAYEWMHNLEWSVKDLIKVIVLSDTYRQSAIAGREVLEKDPDNEMLSRGPRTRLSAEQIRDQALFIAGRLSQKMYGPPVMPFQPEGIWKTPYNSEAWVQSKGEDSYRRAIYTMVKRTAVYPSFETFDMAQRQVCTSRRIATNSPLQALVTLNDPVYVEAAASLADRILREGGASLEEQINYGYALGMAKLPSREKRNVLISLYEQIYSEAKKEGLTEELARKKAMGAVATALLNLDEMLNK